MAAETLSSLPPSERTVERATLQLLSELTAQVQELTKLLNRPQQLQGHPLWWDMLPVPQKQITPFTQFMQDYSSPYQPAWQFKCDPMQDRIELSIRDHAGTPIWARALFWSDARFPGTTR